MHHQSSVRKELQDLVNRLHEAATELGMKINGKKTEVMKVCDDPKPITVTVAGCTLSHSNILELCSTPKRRMMRKSSCDLQSRGRDCAS